MADEMICEICREQPATVHVCFASSGQTKNLCAACYEKDAPKYFGQQGDLTEAIKNGKCAYCGEPADGGCGWTSGGLGGFGWQKQELWCEECAKDLKEFYELPEQREAMDAEFDVADEKALVRAAQEFEEREAAKRQFMALKLLRRRGGG